MTTPPDALKVRRPQVRAIHTHWVPVRCAQCGWYLCAIKPGSVVKVTCRRCKTEIVKETA